MYLDEETYEFIKGEVTALYESYDICCIPISGFEIATKMGLRVIPYSSLSPKKKKAAMDVSEDGFFLEDNEGEEFIYYNDDERPYERINMTILHEIAHCVLDHWTGSEKEESEAIFFAKYAFAPPPLIHIIKPNSPEDIADVFGLSREASVYAFDYYHKWLRYGKKDYTEYEVRILRQFEPLEEVV